MDEDTLEGGTGEDTAAGAGGEDTTEGAGGTILERGGDGDDTLKGAADWPEDWRAKASRGDEDLGKRLERYKSVPDLADALVNAQKKIEEMRAKGSARPTRPEGDDEKALAEFRKENGIPEKAEGYLESLPDGLVIGEEDKEAFASFAEAMFNADMPKDQADKAMAWYQDFQEKAVAAQADQDKQFAAAAIDELREEMGPEYRGNMNAVKNWAEAAFGDQKDNLFGARLADGSLLGDNPAILRAFLRMADEANPAGFVAPADGKSQAQAVDDEIADIEKVMREDRNTYNRDEKMQARYRDLLEARERFNSKAA